MKSLIALWKRVAEDSAARCRTSTTMDYKTVQGRSKHEGMSFLTISLPNYGKDFQKALDQGLVDRNMFQGFSWHAGLPRFLGGFLDRVFDRTSGVLLDDPDIDAILAVRQLTLMFSKILLPCSDAREKEAMSMFVECDKEVRDHDHCMEPSDIEDFTRISSLLFRDLFLEVERKLHNLELVPKHGPGATADKYRGNGKYRNRTWTDRLERYFPSGDYLFPNARYVHEEAVDFLEPGAEQPVRVVSVPKTQKTPRIIAIEPTCMQYVQQAVKEAMTQFVDSSNLVNMIGTGDQTPNQRMAQIGSRNGSLATLDLSEASDRVSNQLVKHLFDRHPLLQEAVDACRSRKADVPGHGVIPLAKFASMGSALTFPIEAMVFLTICFLGIERELNTRFTSKRDLLRFAGEVRVYGDDIIVPVDTVHSVVHALETFGFRVGTAKSFWIGRFRESCGKEYYDGYDVSIVKVRRVFPRTRKHAQEVISIVSLRNQLYKAGYWGTVKWLDEQIIRVIKYFPYADESSPVLGRYSFLGYETQTECEYLHRPLVKGYVVSSRLPVDRLDGQDALLKCFLKRGILPNADEKHLERAGRPRRVDIKLGKVPPF